MDDLSPPKDETPASKLYFYTVISLRLRQLIKDIDGIGSKAREQEIKLNDISDNVKGDDIRNKTIIAIAVLIWTVTCGGISMYIQKGMNAFEVAANRVDQLEKKIFLLETKNDQDKEIPSKVAVLTRTVESLQRQIDSIESKR
jgi:hypothetical protein